MSRLIETPWAARYFSHWNDCIKMISCGTLPKNHHHHQQQRQINSNDNKRGFRNRCYPIWMELEKCWTRTHNTTGAQFFFVEYSTRRTDDSFHILILHSYVLYTYVTNTYIVHCTQMCHFSFVLLIGIRKSSPNWKQFEYYHNPISKHPFHCESF